MPATAFERLLVCYVPAIDLRQVAAGEFPHVGRLLSTRPSVRFRTQPSIDQLATLFTGTWPHRHGLWGPRLRVDWRRRTPVQRLTDLLPDIVTTTASAPATRSGRRSIWPPRRPGGGGASNGCGSTSRRWPTSTGCSRPWETASYALEVVDAHCLDHLRG